MSLTTRGLGRGGRSGLLATFGIGRRGVTLPPTVTHRIEVFRADSRITKVLQLISKLR